MHTQAYLGLRSARRAARGSAVIVGPWSSEVGFELLYWIPFVRRLLRERQVPPKSVVVVSRGGVADWYGDVATGYVDLLEWLPERRLLSERQRRILERGGEKQTSVTRFDREALAHVRERMDRGPMRVLHPATMYRRYRGVWIGRRSPAMVEREVDFAPIDVAPEAPAGLEPGEYIAVKGYFSSGFPDVPENRAALHQLVKRLAQHAPVVLLGYGRAIDDHEHAALPEIPGVVPMAEPASPQTNLGQQTAIVRGARLLVATYGGFSYLGPFVGIPTLAFHSRGTFNRAHLDVLHRAEGFLASAGSHGPDGAGYVEVDLRHISLIDQVAAASEGSPPPPSAVRSQDL